MANKKLTQEEIKQLEKLQQQRTTMLSQLGNLEVSIMKLQKEKEKGLETIHEHQQSEQFYYRVLQEKYGQGRLDLQAKEFISD
jgi:sucrose-6-phosphate hydrolase SacC (GH32 family)